MTHIPALREERIWIISSDPYFRLLKPLEAAQRMGGSQEVIRNWTTYEGPPLLGLLVWSVGLNSARMQTDRIPRHQHKMQNSELGPNSGSCRAVKGPAGEYRKARFCYDQVEHRLPHWAGWFLLPALCFPLLQRRKCQYPFQEKIHWNVKVLDPAERRTSALLGPDNATKKRRALI